MTSIPEFAKTEDAAEWLAKLPLQKQAASMFPKDPLYSAGLYGALGAGVGGLGGYLSGGKDKHKRRTRGLTGAIAGLGLGGLAGTAGALASDTNNADQRLLRAKEVIEAGKAMQRPVEMLLPGVGSVVSDGVNAAGEALTGTKNQVYQLGSGWKDLNQIPEPKGTSGDLGFMLGNVTPSGVVGATTGLGVYDGWRAYQDAKDGPKRDIRGAIEADLGSKDGVLDKVQARKLLSELGAKGPHLDATRAWQTGVASPNLAAAGKDPIHALGPELAGGLHALKNRNSLSRLGGRAMRGLGAATAGYVPGQMFGLNAAGKYYQDIGEQNLPQTP